MPDPNPWTFRAASDVELAPGRVAKATITIIPGVVVEGRVESPVDRAPCPGAQISGIRSPANPVMAVADAAGVFRLRVAPGDTLSYHATAPTPPPASFQIKSSAVVTIPAGVDRLTLPTMQVPLPDAP